MQHEAHRQHREQHKPHGQREDGALVLPECTAVDAARLVEQQRSDEQHEEQLRRNVHSVDGGNYAGHHHASHDLHQGQRQVPYDLGEHRRSDDASQQNQGEFHGMHGDSLLARLSRICTRP